MAMDILSHKVTATTTTTLYTQMRRNWYDGTDQDCDGGDDFDQDEDGFHSDQYGGTDCDDTNPRSILVSQMIRWTEWTMTAMALLMKMNQTMTAMELNHPRETVMIKSLDQSNTTGSWYDGTDQDCDGANDFDQDGDGYDSDQYGGTDCDDTSALVYVGATDLFYDGVDSNCDGFSDYDQDADGYDSDQYGGTDCDDSDENISPGAVDANFDGIDDDCDGQIDEDGDTDQDGDGFTPVGGDCDDTDNTIYPMLQMLGMMASIPTVMVPMTWMQMAMVKPVWIKVVKIVWMSTPASTPVRRDLVRWCRPRLLW